MLAQELVQLRPSVILAPASGPAVAAKRATATIPIVSPALADAVHLGLVASVSRPGAMCPFINDVNHWRQRAEEMRALAEGMPDEVSKKTMLSIAADYERLAKRAEDRGQDG